MVIKVSIALLDGDSHEKKKKGEKARSYRYAIIPHEIIHYGTVKLVRHHKKIFRFLKVH